MRVAGANCSQTPAEVGAATAAADAVERGMSRLPRPIGFFDSGVGGLTVLREVVRRLPAESTIYLGDNARAPYGPRSDDEVRRFSAECLDELAGRDVKAIVVACNTSTCGRARRSCGCATTCRSSASSDRARRRRRWRRATGASA